MVETDLNHAEPVEAWWLVWGRSVFAVTVVALLVALGIANVAMYSRWHEVEDGVLWSARAEGVTATDIAAGTAGAAAARSGDAALLLAVRRLLRRLHVLLQRPVRSSRLGVLLGRRDCLRPAAAAAAAFHDGLSGAAGRVERPAPNVERRTARIVVR